MKDFFKGVIVIAIVSFVFNFLWDLWQLKAYSAGGEINLVSMASYGAIAVLFGLVLFIFLGIINQDGNWLKKGFAVKDVIIILQFGLLIGILVQIVDGLKENLQYMPISAPNFPYTDLYLFTLIKQVILLPIILLISSFLVKATSKRQDVYRFKV